MGLLSLWIINLGYGFEGSLHKFQPSASSVGGAEQPPQNPPVAQTGLTPWVRSLPIPLPKDYVNGIGEVQARSDQNVNVRLRGETRPGGWWYYYLYGILVKEPVAMLLLVAAGTVLAAVSDKYRTDWRREAFLVLCGAAVLCFISSVSVQHFRYGLPVLPFLFIWASRVGRTWQHRQPAVGALAACCLLWSISSSLTVYPHCLAYVNEFTDGPQSCPWHIGGHDWGENLSSLKQWLDAHPESRPFYFACDNGRPDPRLAGIDIVLPPNDGPHPGWYAFTRRRAVFNAPRAYDGRRGKKAVRTDYVRHLPPVTTIGYSIYIYHVTLDEANRFRAENRIPQLPSDGQ